VRIVRDANRGGDVIKRIRALLAKDKAEHVEVDLNRAIREALALMRGTLQYHNVTVRTELAPGLPRVTGDRVQLQQVITNLIANGIEAMASHRPPATRIDRPFRDDRDRQRAGRAARLGHGPRPGDDRPSLRSLLYDQDRWLGMGLTISAAIIEAHGGRVQALPGSPGGAVFQFTLPNMIDGAS
jgi:C4-dicarboxylate-specific signal transduction histidine kinase